MLLGVVSDTHGYVDPRLVEAFAGVDAILHAGDVGSTAVLEALAAIAPVHAVCGNNTAGLPRLRRCALTFDGVALRLVHQLRGGDLARSRLIQGCPPADEKRKACAPQPGRRGR